MSQVAKLRDGGGASSKRKEKPDQLRGVTTPLNRHTPAVRDRHNVAVPEELQGWGGDEATQQQRQAAYDEAFARELPSANALCAIGLAGPVFALIEQPRLGWSSPGVIVPLIGGVAVFAGFLLYEARAKDPMLPLSLFRRRNFSAAVGFVRA